MPGVEETQVTEARGLKKERLDVGFAEDGWNRNERRI